MRYSFVIIFLVLAFRTEALKPKFLRGKFSTGRNDGFVELPKTPQRAYEMGWARPPEDVFSPLITFCDRPKPLVCIFYNRDGDVVKISAIPAPQHKFHTDFRAVTHIFTKARLFGQDLYESTVWFLDPRQAKMMNFTVPDSKYVWGPIETVMSRIEPTAEGMRFVNLLHKQFCLEKMGIHYSILPFDSVQYLADPYTGDMIGWEYVMSGFDGPQRNPLIDDNGSFLIKKGDNLIGNKEVNYIMSKLFSAFHVFLIDDPQDTTCPESLNNIIAAYDKQAKNDDNNFERIHRVGSPHDPETPDNHKNKISLSLNW